MHKLKFAKNFTILTAIKSILVKENKKTKVSIFRITLYTKILPLMVYTNIRHNIVKL